MQFQDRDDCNEDEPPRDDYLDVGRLKDFIEDIPDHFRVYIEKIDDVVYDNFEILEKKEIPDTKSPKELVYKFARGLQLVAFGMGDERDGVYITAFENN